MKSEQGDEISKLTWLATSLLAKPKTRVPVAPTLKSDCDNNIFV